MTDAIAPGYSSIIKNPMDLTTMLSKVDSSLYHSVLDFKVSQGAGWGVGQSGDLSVWHVWMDNIWGFGMITFPVMIALCLEGIEKNMFSYLGSMEHFVLCQQLS